MGMTFLALGTSIPEAMSSIILTRHGFGPLSISNSIQSNIFDILLCLGIPWIFRTAIAPAISGQPAMMVRNCTAADELKLFSNLHLSSLSTQFTLKTTDNKFFTISLTMTLFALYVPFITNKFVLDKKIGFCCTTFYLLFLIFASFVDFHVLLPLNSTRISDY